MTHSSYGKHELNSFLKQLNPYNPKIRFTLEREKNNLLSFLYVLVMKQDNMKLGRRVYRQATHTLTDTNKDFNYHPKHKRNVIKTSVDKPYGFVNLDSWIPKYTMYLQSNGNYR